jgi:hypothetical protein
LAYEEERWAQRANTVPLDGRVGLEEAEGMIAYAAKQVQMYRDIAVRAEVMRTDVKLRKGQRRRFEAAVDDLMAAVEAQEGLAEEVGGDEEDEEDEEDDEEGDVDSDEELLLGGEVDED